MYCLSADPPGRCEALCRPPIRHEADANEARKIAVVEGYRVRAGAVCLWPVLILRMAQGSGRRQRARFGP
jgi:hypothetical protein